ncbi:MAG: hypothetical protein ACI4F7_05135 [Acutalibacteraceae bacterium]
MKIIKTVITAAVSLALFVTTVFPSLAQMPDSGYFPQFHGETGSVGVIDAKTPMTAEKTAEKYAKKFGNSWNDTPGTPIVVGDSLYCLVAGQKKLYRVSKDNGNVIATADCDGTSQFFSLIAYGEGKIFVPRSAKIDGNNVTVVYAYDAETLNQLWISEPIGKPEDRVTPLGSIVYSNGYIYLGVSNGSGAKGAFACVPAADGDTVTPDEIKKAAWQYMPEDGMKSGYYWCGGAVAGNAFVFGGEATELVSHSLTDETVYDRLVLEDNPTAGIRSTVYYDEATRRVFATTKSGYIYSVKLNADNTFDAASLIKTSLGSENTSSPVVFGGRVYVGGGGISGKYGFSVLNAEDLSVIYQISDFKSQSSPVLTTAYANEQNGMTVVLYLTDYQTSKLYAVYDSAGQTTAQFECIATPSATQYCTQSIAADEDGNIYYYNDGGTIFCFGQKNESDAIYTADDVKNQIALYASQPVTAGMLTALQRIKTRMEALDTPSDVTNAEILNKMIDDATALSDQQETVKRLNEELANLDAEAVTLADDAAVTNWLAAYYGLTDENRAGVVRSAELLAAANKLKELKDAAAISELNEKIAALPNEESLTLKGEAEVKSVIQLLSLQNEEVRGAVNSEKLDRLALKLAELHSAVDTLDNAIETQLDPVLITEKHRDAVASLTSDYNALSEDDRAFVKNADTLLYAQRVLAGLDRGVIIAEVFEKLYGTDLVYTYYGDGFTLTFNGADVTDISSDYVIDKNNIPATGDTRNPLIFVVIAAVCAVILVGSIIYFKKGKVI